MTETVLDQPIPPSGPDAAADVAHTFPSYGFAILLSLAVLADSLFYRHAVGLSAALFLLVLATGAAIANKAQASRTQIWGAAAVLVVAVIPIFIEPSPIAILIGAIATAYFAVTVADDAAAAWRDRIINAFALLLDGAWRAIVDFQYLHANRPKREPGAAGAIAWKTWIVPLALGSIFILLFASANPLIENWLAALNFKALFGHLSPARIVFWLIATSLIWPFVFLRVRSKLRKAVESEFKEPTPEAFFPALPTELFGKAAILRSLILFNVLFAMQTALDIAYLWGGVALPDGMSYARYAHRGAYPLIVTALLAAAFVLIATRPSCDANRSQLVRNLVFLFTAQNVVLVVSSILRLDLYVAVYSLTYWRIAAFIWMGLVAIGLILIVARMVLRKSNGWLIWMNLGALALTLYLSGLVSFPKLIADYNVAHSREMGGPAVTLDLKYLTSLGPQAIPAIDRLLVAAQGRATALPCQSARWIALSEMHCLSRERDEMSAEHGTKMQDWRAWSYRDWRLARYIKKKQETEAHSSDAVTTAPEKHGWFWD